MMFIYTFFLAMASIPFNLAAPGLSKLESRITGGDVAEPGEFPFLIAPQLNGRQWCAGTLLNAYTVLTAAHCSINIPPGNVTVRAGSTVRKL
jgi:trypsin